MAYKLISVKCPNCGHDLSIEENRTQAYCSYCGGKILISNENEYVVRKVDEAAIKQAEADREVRLRELDIREQQEKHGRGLRSGLTVVWVILSIVLIGIGLAAGFAGGMVILFYVAAPIIIGGAYLIFKLLPDKETDKITKMKGGIRFPSDLKPFHEKKYQFAAEALRAAGFTNVTCISLHDRNVLTALVNSDKIDKITVNGQRIITGGRVYMPDVPMITYHGK